MTDVDAPLIFSLAVSIGNCLCRLDALPINHPTVSKHWSSPNQKKNNQLVSPFVDLPPATNRGVIALTLWQIFDAIAQDFTKCKRWNYSVVAVLCMFHYSARICCQVFSILCQRCSLPIIVCYSQDVGMLCKLPWPLARDRCQVLWLISLYLVGPQSAFCGF